jgi:hypothetical protein
MSFIIPLSFALITAAGSNIGMIIQIVNKENFAVSICLISMFICVICLTTIACLIYWILPQITPRKTDPQTDDLIDQFIEFKNAIYDRLKEEEFKECEDTCAEKVKEL